MPQGAPTSPALTNVLCLRLDRRISGLAKKLGWRYSRYADDMTFSLDSEHAGVPQTGRLMGLVRRIVEGEGFRVHPEKTRVARSGGCQKVTGLVVNGELAPRTPRKLKRQLRAAIHNLSKGKPLKDGDTVERLLGYAAFVGMSEPALGIRLKEEILAAASQAGG